MDTLQAIKERYSCRNYKDGSIDKEVLETSSQDFENNNSKLITEAYIDSVENDIKTKIKQKGYEVINIRIDIIENENQDTYGTIENINLKIKKIEEDEEKVEERQIDSRDIRLIEIPSEAYAYQFYDMQVSGQLVLLWNLYPTKVSDVSANNLCNLQVILPERPGHHRSI